MVGTRVVTHDATASDGWSGKFGAAPRGEEYVDAAEEEIDDGRCADGDDGNAGRGTAGHDSCGSTTTIASGERSAMWSTSVRVTCNGIGAMCTIADLIKYRRQREKLVKREISLRLPTAHGTFDLFAFSSIVDQDLHIALTVGSGDPNEIDADFRQVHALKIERIDFAPR